MTRKKLPNGVVIWAQMRYAFKRLGTATAVWVRCIYSKIAVDIKRETRFQKLQAECLNFREIL